MPIHSSSNYWILETDSSAYSFGLNNAGILTHCYWGARLPAMGDYPPPVNPREHSSFDPSPHLTPEEFPGYGALRYIDPALKVTFSDGTRDVALVYVDYALRDSVNPELVIRLKDEHYPLQVNLNYRIHEKYDLIERWISLQNHGETPILVERAFSAKWSLPQGDNYFFTHMYGRHIGEYNLIREMLTPGIKTIESRRLTTSHHHSPWFAIDSNANENSGDVWFGTLAWSGNWKISAEVTEFASTRVNIGLNDWDFAWKLLPGEPLLTPPAISGYTSSGFGLASRNLHDYVRNEVLPHKQRLHKVLYNSWEATTFHVDETSQIALAEIAARMGIELFVMDDGWFHGRNADNAGLGDWRPDEVKFPNGLGRLVQKVNALGMDFGLWVEPEMVNPDSDLYRAHPDWVIHFPTRTRSESRRQLILNLAREDVQEYLISVLDKILSDYNIAFIKWDMNRNVSEPGWENAPGDPRELWVRYVTGLYRVWGTLREHHPQVIWQSCSGGGGRADLGILQFADQVWISDNTEAIARLSIQEGYSQFLPANTMEAWVTDWGKDLVPLEFRFHVSMCGSLGVGGNLNEWSQAERELAEKCIRLYKEIQPIIQLGDQYRLISPQKHQYSAVQYVSKDKEQSVLFVFRVAIPDPANLPVIQPLGLEPNAFYQIEGFPEPKSGKGWMECGLMLELKNLQSKLVRIRRI
jgi:alpha-galactosidase